VKKVFFIILIFTLISCGKSIKDVAKNAQEGEIPESQFENAEITFVRNNSIKNFISAEEILKYYDDDNVYCKQIEIEFFDKDLKKESFLKAEKGVLKNNYEDIELNGDVYMLSLKDSVEVFTDTLYYDKGKDLIFNNSYVMIKDKNGTITGEKFDAKPDFSEINLYKVKGKGVIPDSLLKELN